MQTSVARRQRQRRNGAARRSGGGSTGRRSRHRPPALPLRLLPRPRLHRVRRGRRRLLVVQPGPPRPQGDAREHRPEPGDVRLRPHRQGRARPLRASNAARSSTSPTSRRSSSTPRRRSRTSRSGRTRASTRSASSPPAIDTLRGRERGASTITQQLVRARLLPASAFEGSVYERKIKEIIQSIRLTQEYPGREGKEEIIAAYLNQNFYGNNSYGVKAAARSYFGVTDLKKLTLAQAAILAGDPAVPLRVRPREERREAGGATARRRSSSRPTAPIVVAPQLHPRT